MYRGEWFNSLTHLVGAIAAAIGLIVLLAAGGGDPVRLTAFAIYGITLVALYTLSTLYHSLRGRKKGVFRRCDPTAHDPEEPQECYAGKGHEMQCEDYGMAKALYDCALFSRNVREREAQDSKADNHQ